MGTEKINRLKIVLVEQGKTGKWLAEQLEMLMKIAEILEVNAKDLINKGKFD